MLSDEDIQTFHRDGVVVIENVLSPREIQEARDGLHTQLLSMGVDHEALLNGTARYEEIGPRTKARSANIWYSMWKMQVHLDSNVYMSVKQLMYETYFSGSLLYKNPWYGGFDKIHRVPKVHPGKKYVCDLDHDSPTILPFIDRICYRVPDHIHPEGGLDMHMDLNPVNPFHITTKWRPIQCFVALTDHFTGDSGGLRVVKGYHREFDQHFKYDPTSTEGPFYRMGGSGFTALQKRLEPVYAPAGSLVCWDYRLPHATAQHLISDDTREVVYTGWLPDIPANKEYQKQQLINLNKNVAPPGIKLFEDKSVDRGTKGDKLDVKELDRDWVWDELTTYQKDMLGYFS